MATLQDRLQKAFGALGEGQEAPAWRPASTTVFRAGGRAEDAGNSSEEEYEERQRREAVPGLAQTLAVEDEPNEEGFRPSTAFCRALDAEEEYNEVDEMATGLLARRAGVDLLPPRDMQVLEDNVYEQRALRAVLGPRADDTAEEQLAAEDHMELEAPAGSGGAGEPAAQQQEQQQVAAAGPSRSSLAAAAAGSPKERKKVRFEGVAQPWVPPARRPGYQQRCTDLPPGEGGAAQPRQQRGQGLSVVPDHVKNPQKYTCYVLDEPLVVGGGVAQLSSAQQEHDVTSAAAVAGDEEAPQPEPERWQGGVGAGVVPFQPRQQRSGSGAAEAAAGGGQPVGGSGATALRPGPQLAFGGEEDGTEEAPAGDGCADVAMADAGAAQQQPRGKRHYRRSRAATDAD